MLHYSKGGFEMKKTGLILGAALLALIFIAPSSAIASWSESLFENGWYGGSHYDFTKYEGFIVSDPEKTSFEGFTPANSGWETTIVNPGYAFMSGPAVSGLNFTALFSGEKYNGFTWDVVAWEGDKIIGGGRIVEGSSFSFTEFSAADVPSYNRNSPVPVPAPFLLLASGLIGLVGIKRKKLLN
jgi:hypothetical protein